MKSVKMTRPSVSKMRDVVIEVSGLISIHNFWWCGKSSRSLPRKFVREGCRHTRLQEVRWRPQLEVHIIYSILSRVCRGS